MNDTLNDDFTLNEQLRQLREKTSAHPDTPDVNKIVDFFFTQFPFLITLLKTIDKTGQSVDKLASFYYATKGLTQAARGFQITATVLAGIDFITVPLAFLACRLLGKTFPFTFSTAAKWIYSAVIFALAITALAVPAIAIPIALTTVSLALATSLFTLGKHFWLKQKLVRELNNNNEKLSNIEEKIENIRILANDLTANQENKSHICALFEQRQSLLIERQHFVNKNAELSQKQKHLSIPRLADKTVGVILASVTLVGLVLGAFFPPVGLSILVATSISSLAYLVGRVSFAIVTTKKIKMQPTQLLEEEEHLALSDDGEKIHEGTLGIVKNLYSNPRQGLLALKNSIYQESEIANLVHRRFAKIIASKDPNLAIEFMVDLGNYLQSSNKTGLNLADFFYSIDNFEQVIPMLRCALDLTIKGRIPLSDEQITALNSVPQIKKYLEGKQDAFYIESVKGTLVEELQDKEEQIMKASSLERTVYSIEN